MAIRDVVRTATSEERRVHCMTQIIVTEDREIFAVWSVDCGDGKHRGCSVQVGPALTERIRTSPAVRVLMDAIRDDTFTRTGAA